MIGVVLVTHGNLALEFRAALEHVVGPQKQLETICIGPNDNMEDRRRDILKATQKTDKGQGVVLATDMFGGTPSNIAISLLEKAKVEVIAGVNLPMLIKMISLREIGQLDLAGIVREAQQAGRKYISVASDILTDRKS